MASQLGQEGFTSIWDDLQELRSYKEKHGDLDGKQRKDRNLYEDCRMVRLSGYPDKILKKAKLISPMTA